MKTFVGIGDSIVAGEGDDSGRGGWVGRLREKLAYDDGTDAGWTVYNLGIGGNSIRDVESRLGEVLLREPGVLVLGCLTNDVVMYPDGDELQPKLPRHVREASWNRVLMKLKQVCPHVMVTPGVYFDKDYIHPGPGPAAGRGARKEAADAHLAFIEKACVAHGVEFLPVPAEFADDLLKDHDVHWNGRGYDLLAKQIYDKLTELKWI